MCTKRLVTSALLTTLGLLVPTTFSASAAGTVEDPLLASDNLTIHEVIPAPAAIGARFRGNYMYLTTSTGLVIYDISNPTTPIEVGRQALPHFENEDVDLGGDILLISNDAAESYGLLHVIDISDPAAPEILTSYHMGSNPMGPVVDAADFLGLVGEQGNPGHTASCILDCRFAWVTDSGGMRLIDLRAPATPATLGNFTTPAAGSLGITHDVQMDENGIAWISGFGGVAGYQIPADYAEAVTAASAAGGSALRDYHTSLLVTKTSPAGHSQYDVTLGLDDGSTYNDYILHNSRRLEDSDVVYVTEEDYNRPGCEGAGSFETWRLPMREETAEDGTVRKVITGEPMTPIDKWETELLADLDQNPSGRPQATAMCSAHYFDVLQNVVAQGWYEQGMRLLDVSDPANIRQIGYFIPPNGESWAAYFAPTDPAGRVLYMLDASLGLVVLEYDRLTDGPLAMPKPNPPLQDTGDGTNGGSGGDSGNGGTAGNGETNGGTGGGNGSGGGSSSEGSQPPTSASSGDGSTSSGSESSAAVKKPCKSKRTPKARQACRKKRRGGASAAGTSTSGSYEPTVVAPIRAEWFTSVPASAPSRSFGYACRIVL